MTHKSYKCASEWLMHVAVCGIAGPPDQSSPSSGNKCRMARPLTMPNFIALGQTIYEKSVINFNHLWIVAPLWPKFANLGTDIVRAINVRNFVPFLQHVCRYIYLCQISLISLTAWPTNWKKECLFTRGDRRSNRSRRPIAATIAPCKHRPTCDRRGAQLARSSCGFNVNIY